MKKSLLVLVTCFFCAGSAFAAHDSTHWGYSGETGPEHWGSLSPEFKMCGEGKQQSPINITGAVDKELPALQLNYGKSSLKLVNNGHTLKADYEPGSNTSVGGETYNLLQFHFHSLSENAIEGELFPLEAHLVHANTAGELAVVGVMFKEGVSNPLLEKLWSQAPKDMNATVSDTSASISVSDLLPANTDYYGFTGSLTTPPCTEGVRWMVLKQAVTASPEQISKFRSFFGGHDTNRPVQPLNERTVYK